MKTTAYFRHTQRRPDRARIKYSWIQQAVDNPLHEQIQSDGRIRRWTHVGEEDRYLRVILLEDGETVHNAFFDRSFRGKEGTT